MQQRTRWVAEQQEKVDAARKDYERSLENDRVKNAGKYSPEGVAETISGHDARRAKLQSDLAEIGARLEAFRGLRGVEL